MPVVEMCIKLSEVTVEAMVAKGEWGHAIFNYY